MQHVNTRRFTTKLTSGHSRWRLGLLKCRVPNRYRDSSSNHRRPFPGVEVPRRYLPFFPAAPEVPPPLPPSLTTPFVPCRNGCLWPSCRPSLPGLFLVGEDAPVAETALTGAGELAANALAPPPPPEVTPGLLRGGERAVGVWA